MRSTARAKRALLGGAAVIGLVTASLLVRERGASDSGSGWLPDLEAVPRSSIDAEAARALFSPLRKGEPFHYDPVAVLLPDPDHEETWTWEEHPGGRFTIRTNDRGFREDEPTPIAKKGIRILVAGDSHTFGVANNRETFPNVLEELLSAWDRERGFEVINAGVSYTGPYCYRGVLERHLDLDPDAFVAAHFTGNDFLDDLRILFTLEGERLATGSAAYYRALEAAAESWSPALYQGFNQIYRFREHPEERERALAAVVGSFERMQGLCRERGILFVALVLPTKADVDLADDTQELREALGLSEAEAADNARLGAEFEAAMRARGIPCVNPTARMRASDEVLYWRRDQHLGLAGHALVAAELFAALKDLL